MTREGYNKHKEFIEAWANGALIEWFDEIDTWRYEDYPLWNADVQYRIKPQEPKKKTIILETWLCKGGDDNYFTVEGTEEYHEEFIHENFIKLLSTREVEIDD